MIRSRFSLPPRLAPLAFSVLLTATALFGDAITMKNGDRLTGTVIRVEGDSLTLKSELAGEVKIPFAAITSIDSGAPLSLVLKDGQTIVGSLKADNDRYTVTTAAAGTVETTKEKIATIRSEQEQARYLAALDRLTNPGLLDLWTGFFDAGYAATRGNAETNTLNLGANLTRSTSRDKISLSFTSINTNARLQGKTQQTANAIRGGGRYDLNLSKKSFVFALSDLEFDEFQRLDLRFVLGGGGGYRVVKSKTTVFDLFSGANLHKEFFSTGLRRTSTELILGNELNRKLASNMVLTERLVFYPNVSNTGNYRLNFDTALSTNINKWMAWNVGFSNRYLSNPVPGAKTNDLLFTTGIRLTFAKPAD
jgi:putative salt-induced outer membrane protein YdiY